MNKLIKAAAFLTLFFAAATQAAVVNGTYSTSATAPTADVLVSYDDDSGTMSARNQTTTADRTVGQGFTLSATAQVNRVTVEMGNSLGFPGSAGDHILWLGIMKDTTGNDQVDTQVGDTYAFDLSGFTMTKNSYITFEFDALSLDAGLYAFELGWKEDGSDTYDDEVQNFVLFRDQSDGTYAGGGQVGKQLYTTVPNAGLNAISSAHDLTFFIQEAEEVAPPPVATTLFEDDFSTYADQAAFVAAYDNLNSAPGAIDLEGSGSSAIVHSINPVSGFTRFRTKDAFGVSADLFSIQFDVRLNSQSAPGDFYFALQDDTHTGATVNDSFLDDRLFLSNQLTEGSPTFQTVDIVVNLSGSTENVAGTSDTLDSGKYHVYIDGSKVVTAGTAIAGTTGAYDFSFFTWGAKSADSEFDNLLVRDAAIIGASTTPATPTLSIFMIQ